MNLYSGVLNDYNSDTEALTLANPSLGAETPTNCLARCTLYLYKIIEDEPKEDVSAKMIFMAKEDRHQNIIFFVISIKGCHECGHVLPFKLSRGMG